MPINYFDIKNGVIGYSQKNYRLKRHAHFPIEVVFALSGQVDIVTDNHQYTNIQSAIINSNAPHTFSCFNGSCQLYFIDPTSYAGKHISTYYRINGEDLVLLNNIKADLFKENHILSFEKNNKCLAGVDSRIQSCLDWISQNYSMEGINMTMISENIFLSESRLAHLFKEQIGISIHQYILWKKIEMAIKLFMEGKSLIDCAYSSGFADSSHLNKTFKKMFGIYPSFENKK